jgi:hypothetical protein
MSAAGLEPATNGLKGHCSTIELRARHGAFYHVHWDASTQRTAAHQKAAVFSWYEN